MSLLECNGRISECIKTKDSLNVTHSWWWQHNRLVNCPAAWPSGPAWTLFGKPIKALAGPGPGSRASPVLETVAYWDIMMSSAAVL